VIRAGVEAVREGGLESLGIRALAERLGVTPMALYRHVESAERLEAEVVERILAAVPPAPAGEAFRAHAVAWARAAHAALVPYPGIARHVLTSWFRLERVLDWLEGLLVAAERSGMKGARGVAAANAVFTFVLMRVQMEESIRAAGVIRRKLPGGKKAARWPLLHQNAAEYEVAQLDRHFSYGLQVLLAGIEGNVTP
jgi:AcrR family transcriptional regulator